MSNLERGHHTPASHELSSTPVVPQVNIAELDSYIQLRANKVVGFTQMTDSDKLQLTEDASGAPIMEIDPIMRATSESGHRSRWSIRRPFMTFQVNSMDATEFKEACGASFVPPRFPRFPDVFFFVMAKWFDDFRLIKLFELHVFSFLRPLCFWTCGMYILTLETFFYIGILSWALSLFQFQDLVYLLTCCIIHLHPNHRT